MFSKTSYHYHNVSIKINMNSSNKKKVNVCAMYYKIVLILKKDKF